MFQFIHSADIHLDSPMYMLERYEGAPVDEIRSATRRALENLVELAISRHVDFVLLCGDLYDGDWRDYNTGLFFMSQMAKLHDAQIPVFLIAGNHDAANRMTRTLRLPDGIHLLKAGEPSTILLDHVGAAVHGQSFVSQAVHDDLSEKYPAAVKGFYNIGMLHTCASGRPGHDSYAPCTIRGLSLKNYDYWALGHVHKREVLSETPLIVFPGNIQGRHIRETGPKGCMLVTVDEKGDARPEFSPLDVVRWEKIEIDASGADSESVLFERLMEETARIAGTTDLPLILRVIVSGRCPVHDEISESMERLVNEIRSESMLSSGGRIWIEKVILDTVPPVEDRLRNPTGPVSELLAIIGEMSTDPQYLESIGGCLGDLWGKLPKEVRDSIEDAGPDDIEALKKLIGEVPSILLRRLRHPIGGTAI
jgi:DNA repair exonuclease SbcCD nuclease subunit